jgi:hypothetical protein
VIVKTKITNQDIVNGYVKLVSVLQYLWERYSISGRADLPAGYEFPDYYDTAKMVWAAAYSLRDEYAKQQVLFPQFVEFE